MASSGLWKTSEQTAFSHSLLDEGKRALAGVVLHFTPDETYFLEMAGPREGMAPCTAVQQAPNNYLL